MLIAGEQWLPQYRNEIALAKERQKNGPAIPYKDYKGIRGHEKTVAEMKLDKAAANENAGETDKAKKRV